MIMNKIFILTFSLSLMSFNFKNNSINTVFSYKQETKNYCHVFHDNLTPEIALKFQSFFEKLKGVNSCVIHLESKTMNLVLDSRIQNNEIKNLIQELEHKYFE